MDSHVYDPALRTQLDSFDKMIRVERAMPKLLTDTEIDRIYNEYMMHAVENINESCYMRWSCETKFFNNDKLDYTNVKLYGILRGDSGNFLNLVH
ncbi:unnamed protein product [Adineta steineri]|uniref:Uncharacterized protein n=1 Tax=Adineta steineri TaxID=433720 RepID=A0A814RIZ7_9BILA|nr:unnamed protein product [Adineta steineri]CAF1201870.1 unnamed protein product [Adineta steineri]